MMLEFLSRNVYFPKYDKYRVKLFETLSNIKLTHLHYFDVDQEDIARKIGLKKDRNGKWYLPQYSTSSTGFDKKASDSIRIFGNPIKTLKID